MPQMMPWWMQQPPAMMAPAGNTDQGNINRIATPKSQDEFDALPDGTFYIEPDDGHIYQKGRKTRPNPKHLRDIEA